MLTALLNALRLPHTARMADPWASRFLPPALQQAAADLTHPNPSRDLSW